MTGFYRKSGPPAAARVRRSPEDPRNATYVKFKQCRKEEIMEKYFIKLAKLFLSRISDEFKLEISKAVNILEKKAKKSENHFNNMFIEVLKIVLNIDIKPEISKAVDTPEKTEKNTKNSEK